MRRPHLVPGLALVGAVAVGAVALGAALRLDWAAPEAAAAATSPPPASALPAGILEALLARAEDGAFERPAGAWRLSLPRDHGAHVGARAETWMLSAHLTDPGGRPVLVQFSLSRFGLSPETPEPAGAIWDLRALYRAHVLVAQADGPVAACQDEETGATGPLYRSALGPVPAAEQRPGDAEAGRRALLNGPYVSYGIPYDAYRRVVAETAPEDRVPGRAGRNAELPYALTAHVNDDGVEIVSSNCLTCHAGRIEGELIIGLGNEFADFTTDPRRLALQAGSYVRGEAQTAAWAHWADRLEGIAPYIRTRTVGVNPATNLTWALMAHRDPRTLAWSDTPLIDPPPEEPLPLSVPPWWTMSKKNAMFYTTIGRGDHAHFMLLASMLCVESPDELDEIDAYAPDIRAFIADLDAPAWPWDIDERLAAEGERLFVRACSACHGTYGETESYPNRVYALEEVGTDPAYARAATGGARDRFYEWVARSPYGDAHTAAPAPGYIAPPLDGMWATAPYLHNGSVPSMSALLSPATRPTYWRHEPAPRRYDREAMGWRVQTLPAGQSAEADPAARREIYDTTLEGYGNAGHTYGSDLSAEERAALIEYLKTL